ncbi:MAG: RNA polymerase sigma factor [Spirochaetia bacterium]|nr:RNA polymerase sigma factor [Spirochaetia bacterium]
MKPVVTFIIFAFSKLDEGYNEMLQKFWDESAKYRQRLYYLALGYIQNSDEAEDMVQETFEKGAKNYESFKKKSGLYTWLVRILINNCKDFHKKHKRKKIILFSETKNKSDKKDYTDITDERENISKKIELSEAQECLIRIAGNMNEKYKGAVYLRYFEDLSYHEISEALNISEGTVKSRLSEARRLIRIQMESFGFGEDIIGL